ncbi:MAG: hypothetical protein ACRDWA_12905 [Acidimicrobiia bacterium]
MQHEIWVGSAAMVEKSHYPLRDGSFPMRGHRYLPDEFLYLLRGGVR